MPYNYKTLYDTIISAIACSDGATERMHAVIDECEKQNPHPDWERMRKIDFNADAETIKNWLTAAFQGLAPEQPRRGLWFGLNNPVVEGNVTADVYVSAAPTFDPTSMEWACDIERPHAGSSLGSAVLGEIYAIAYESKQGLQNDAEYPLVLAYGGIAAHCALSQNLLPPTLYGILGAAAGFDSGDFLVLGSFANNQFVSNVRAA